MDHSKQRKGKGKVPFGKGGLAVKFGDTKFLGRFYNPRVTLKSALAKRYGGALYATVSNGWYFVGYTSRPVRVLTEVTVGWLASEAIDADMWSSDVWRLSGDEGFYAQPAMVADGMKAVDAVREAVCNSKIFTSVFSAHEYGKRSVDKKWIRTTPR